MTVATAEAHARQRARERYSLDLTAEDMEAIAEQCRRGIDVLWSYPQGDRRKCKVRYEGAEVVVVYDAVAGTLVTVLPDE